MTENFDNFLPVDHFFDITIHIAQCFLLFDEVLPTVAGNEFEYLHDEEYHNGYQNGQIYAGVKHCADNCHNGNDGRKHLRYAHGKHLTQGICIVGVTAHDIPMGMGIKIPDRQPLHVGEHLVTDFLQNPLGDGNHGTVVKECCQNTNEVNGSHGQHRLEQSRKIRRSCFQQWCDIIVNNYLQEQGTCNTCHRTDQNTDQNNGKTQFILFQIAEQTVHGDFVHFCPSDGYATSGTSHMSTHSSSPPFC